VPTSTAVKLKYLSKTYQQYLYRVRFDSELCEKLSEYGFYGGNVAALIRELLGLFFSNVDMAKIPALALDNLRPHTATKPVFPFDGDK
jgi:hypothetical protein